jgi:hypothetical protein
METKELDFIAFETGDKWTVYAKNSYFLLGHVVWEADKKAYDFVPNANGKLTKITQQESARNELIAFCKEQTTARIEEAGNR